MIYRPRPMRSWRAVAALARIPTGEIETHLFRTGSVPALAGAIRAWTRTCWAARSAEADTLLLYDLASGVVEAGRAQPDAGDPVLGYSTMERATSSNEVVTAKTRAPAASPAFPRRARAAACCSSI